MNENAGQFRSAAIGGFHRQDVLDYFERITRENQEEKDAILAEKDAAAAALEEERAARARAEMEKHLQIVEEYRGKYPEKFE